MNAVIRWIYVECFMSSKLRVVWRSKDNNNDVEELTAATIQCEQA